MGKKPRICELTRLYMAYTIFAITMASVCLLSLALRAWIWVCVSILMRWLNEPDPDGWWRDHYQSEVLVQLGIAGIHPNNPHRFLGVPCQLLKDKMSR